MIRVAVCEDKEEDLECLLAMLCEARLPLEVYKYTNAENLVWDVETEQERFDICLLDIYLPGINGVEAARRIRAVSEDTLLIFLSVSDDFYREAFDLYAFHYLIKPLKQDDLTEVLKKAVNTIDQRSEDVLEITFRGRTAIVPCSEISYIYSSNHNIYIRLQGGQEYTVYGKLDEFAYRLKADLFVRCHKSFIVNLLHVRELTPAGFRMEDTVIPISRSYAAQAREQYHQRLFGIFQDR